MKINILSKVVFDDRLGRLTKGQTVEVPDHKALFYFSQGMAEPYQTKVMRDYPLEVAGIQSSASPVDQVLTKQTLNSSESGEKKTRKKKEPS